MAEDGKKVAIGLGIVGLIGGLIYKFTRVEAAPPPEGPAATIQIEVIGAESHSPANVEEGVDYIVRVTITNLTTKAGAPWEATLNMRVVANIAGETILGPVVSDEYFTAGQTKSFDFLLSIPFGAGGLSGSIAALIRDPADIVLATGTEPIVVIEVPIIYGAAVVIGV